MNGCSNVVIISANVDEEQAGSEWRGFVGTIRNFVSAETVQMKALLKELKFQFNLANFVNAAKVVDIDKHVK